MSESKAGSDIGQMKNRRSLLSTEGLTEVGLYIYWLRGHGSEQHRLKVEEIVPLTLSQNMDLFNRAAAEDVTLARSSSLKYFTLNS